MTLGHLSMLWSRTSSSVSLPLGSRIVERPIDGSTEGRELAHVPGPVHLEDVSADGRVALFRDSKSTLFFVRLDGSAAEAVATIVQTGEPVGKASFSPDGRWIVYQSAGLQQQEGVFVREFPGPGLRNADCRHRPESSVAEGW